MAIVNLGVDLNFNKNVLPQKEYDRKLVLKFILVLMCFSLIVFGTITRKISLFDFDGTEEFNEYKSPPDHFNEAQLSEILSWSSKDPRLISHIRKEHLIPPSIFPYNLRRPDKIDWSQRGETEMVKKLFAGRNEGFFVEAGAYDGETYSNTLYFEVYRNWTGLLVEPDPTNLRKLIAKNRKAWIFNGCLHGGQNPARMEFGSSGDEMSSVSEIDLESVSVLKYIFTKLMRPANSFKVWCFPLESVMAAIGQTKIDYMILDVEGGEIPILNVIGTDWSQFDIDVIQVEYMAFEGTSWNKRHSLERLKLFRNYFSDKLPFLEEYGRVFLDVIFAKSSLIER